LSYKLKYIFYLFVIGNFLLNSCSSEKSVISKEINAIKMNHWKSNFHQNNNEILLSSTKKINVKNSDFNLGSLKITNEKDSVKIITKTNRQYIGTITREVYDGYYIKIKNSQEIFISNNEIKEIIFFKEEKLPDPKKESTNSDIYPIESNEDFYSEEEDISDVNENNDLNRKLEPLSLLSFIFGILGFTPIPLIGGLGWIAAVILSKAGRKKIDQNPEKYKGKGFANAGKILGWIGITLMLVALVLIIILIAAFL